MLRLIQGLALGGEWGGAALMVNDYDPGGNALIPIVAVQLLTAFNSPWPISIYLAGFLL